MRTATQSNCRSGSRFAGFLCALTILFSTASVASDAAVDELHRTRQILLGHSTGCVSRVQQPDARRLLDRRRHLHQRVRRPRPQRMFRRCSKTAATKRPPSAAAQRQARATCARQSARAATIPSSRQRDFDTDFANLTNPNPYFPLGIGNRWEFRSATRVDRRAGAERDQADRRRALHRRARRSLRGRLAHRRHQRLVRAGEGRHVWYCGEETAEFETFKGDRPMKPELVSIDGSFKADRDGDKPGIIFLANPLPGQTYIEEVVARQRRGCDAGTRRRLLVRQESRSSTSWCRRARAAALRGQLRRHQELLAARARSVRAQVLRTRHRRLPGDGAANRRSRTPREVQRGSALRLVAPLIFTTERAGDSRWISARVCDL